MGSSQNSNWITQWVTWSLSWQLSFRLNLYNSFKLSRKFLVNTLHTYRDRPPPFISSCFFTYPAFLYSLYLTLYKTDTYVGPKGVSLREAWLLTLQSCNLAQKSTHPTFTILLLSADHRHLLPSHCRPKLGDESFQSTSANSVWYGGRRVVRERTV